MIQFPCRCGNIFRLEDDEAGNSMQCPKCGLLVDVPLLGDIHRLADDGTYKLDESPPAPKPRVALADLIANLGIDPEDPKASSIDLRLTPEQIAQAGAPTPPPVTRPRYDPETGEIMRPLEIKEPALGVAKKADVPFAKPAITYSTRSSVPSEAWSGSIRALCSPINIVVILTDVAAELIVCLGILYSIHSGFFPLTGFLFLVQLLLLAQLGNIIDEAATEERDDLPRLLRDLRLHEDIWSPLVAILGSVFICYAPAQVCLMAASMDRATFFSVSNFLLMLGWVIGVCIVTISVIEAGLSNIEWANDFFRPLFTVLAASIACFLPAGICIAVHAGYGVLTTLALLLSLAGTGFLPGVLLTLTTSGSVMNLSPGRVLSTIRICGARYLSPLFSWVLALITFGAGLSFAMDDIFNATSGGVFGTKLSSSTLAYPLMAAGIIILHFCGFELGMLYRKHHRSFPWLLQRHSPVHHPRRSAAIRSATRRVARPNAMKR
jgi:hypothetical protein